MKASMIASIPAMLLAATAAHADLSISSQPTHDVNCAGGVCIATAKSANLNTIDLTQMLAAGDATVKTGGGALDIDVRDGFSWTNASRLTLDANRSIEIRKPVTVAGQGAVTMTYNDGGTNGDLLFSKNGRIDFWDVSSALAINATNYTLVNGIAGLASAIAANPSGAYALASDYDAQKDGVYAHAPVDTPLTGVFEGLGHEIANVSVSTSDNNIGFFVFMDGTARDFKLRALVIKATNSYQLGLLAAGIENVVENVQVDGTINLLGTTASVVGGLAGVELDVNLVNCAASVSITSANKFYAGGGLVGYDLSGGKIVRSHASGDLVSGLGKKAIAGGLLGEAGQSLQFADIEESYATVNVTVSSSDNEHTYAGGLVGIGATVSNSYATGKVTGGGSATLGGLVGTGVDGGPTLKSVYATGAVSASNRTGGLVGRNSKGAFQSAYWDLDTTGQSSACGNRCRGAQGLSDAQLKAGLPPGFDPKIWAIDPKINNGYPYLRNNPPE
jgi:hypothetical protein